MRTSKIYKGLSEQDACWLRRLDDDIWRRTKDRFGSEHPFEIEGSLSPEDLARVGKLITTHTLPCALGSGIYGNLFMSVFDHQESILRAPGDRVITLGQRHIFSSSTPWNERFAWFSAYTHTAENRRLCAFYGLPEPLNRGHYEY